MIVFGDHLGDCAAAFVGQGSADVFIVVALFARMMVSRRGVVVMLLNGMVRRYLVGRMLRWLFRGGHPRHGRVVLVMR